MCTFFGNVALIFSGTAMKYLRNLRYYYPTTADAWGIALKTLMILISIMGVIAMLTFKWIYKRVSSDP
jgi:ATP/ADP translocase